MYSMCKPKIPMLPTQTNPFKLFLFKVINSNNSSIIQLNSDFNVLKFSKNYL